MTTQEYEDEIRRRDEIIASYKALNYGGSFMTNGAKLFYALWILLIGAGLGFFVATAIHAGW